VKTEKRRSNRSIVAFCYYLELNKKVRANFGRKCSKDKKYWDFSGTDKNTSVASPLQVNLPATVITWDKFPKQSIFKDLRHQFVSRRCSYKTVRDRIYKGRGR